MAEPDRYGDGARHIDEKYMVNNEVKSAVITGTGEKVATAAVKDRVRPFSRAAFTLAKGHTIFQRSQRNAAPNLNAAVSYQHELAAFATCSQYTSTLQHLATGSERGLRIEEWHSVSAHPAGVARA